MKNIVLIIRVLFFYEIINILFILYSEVDNNPEYDDLEVEGQDEEDKYFDGESPEDVQSVKSSMEASEEEDGLDTYMRNLKPDSTPNDLADQMEQMIGH